jgi:tRNA-splicing ligase RtcB
MEWIKKEKDYRVPIKSWSREIEPDALKQAENLARHPVVVKHVALMPDCHLGFGMPIGGVIACQDAVIPNAVGVDIGCGMCAVKTDKNTMDITKNIREILDQVKFRVPVGEGHAHKKPQDWNRFKEYCDEIGINNYLYPFKDKNAPGWLTEHVWELALKNLGTLGGGNHFIELQKSDTGQVWLMLHSGSRHMGYMIASYYHKKALRLNEEKSMPLPSRELAYLSVNEKTGKDYIRDMNFALSYALENRRRMMDIYKETVSAVLKRVHFTEEVNIHHNYAVKEKHFGRDFWIHRKGATSAKKNEIGIIPGSMGTSSYIVRGLGNPESFMSCSHGAGRRMGRMAACRTLDVKECNKAMEGIVFDKWGKIRKKKEALWDLGEAPQAYKDIDEVIEAQMDLIEPLVKLQPLGVIKG